MIHSEHRSLLTDALTPPSGYVFEAGFATSFSLDLVTLLTLPMHLAWLGAGQADKGASHELPIFEALHRTSDRLSIFCHAGRMSIPKIASPLLALLEGMVHETLPLHGGAFHPKVWLLKFAGTSPRQLSKLRLLVLSRNLTDDRSWDLSLTLDGTVGSLVQAGNEPLLELIRHVQVLSRRPMTSQRRADLAMLSDLVQRCAWELPPGFNSLRFHLLGAQRSRSEWLPAPDRSRWDELAVISPFVKAGALERLAGLTKAPLFLICRPDEMDAQIEGTEQLFHSTHVLSNRADGDSDEEDSSARLTGLHAKAFIGKRGKHTHMFVGSANATDAALLHGSNVEFMAELISKTGQGPAEWLGPNGLGSFLEPYARAPAKDVDKSKDIERSLEAVRDCIVRAQPEVHCSQQEDRWDLTLQCRHEVESFAEVAVQVWPLSIVPNNAVSWPAQVALGSLRLAQLAEHEITTFTGFKLTLQGQELSFALNLPGYGLPEGRELSILRSALRNRDGFIQYLLLLLGNWEDPSSVQPALSSVASGSWQASHGGDVPLFEMLAQAFSKEPDRLAQIANILERLKGQGDTGDDIVPEEFWAMWESFEQAMQEDERP